MEQSGSKTPTDVINEHKKKLAEKTDKRFNAYIKHFINIENLLEESILSSNKTGDKINKSLTKINNENKKILTAINKVQKELVKSQKEMKKFLTGKGTKDFVPKMVKTFDDKELFDDSITQPVKGVSDSVIESFDGLFSRVGNDKEEDVYDSSVITKDDFEDFSDDLRSTSEDIADIFGESINPLVDSINSYEPPKASDVSSLTDQILTSIDNTLMLMNQKIDSIAVAVEDWYQERINEKNKKKGATGNPTEEDDKDKGFSLTDMLGAWLGWKALKPLLGKLTKSMLGQSAKYFKLFFGSIWKGIKNAFSFMYDTLFKKHVDKIVKFATSYFGALKNTVIEIVKSSWQKITEKIASVFSGLWKPISNFVAKMGKSKLLKWIVEPIKGLMSHFSGVFKFISTFTEKLFSPVMKFFKVLGKGGIKAVPFIGQIITVVMTLWDFFEGFGDDEASETIGKAKDLLTFWDKFKSGISSVLSGLTFGLISSKTIYENVIKPMSSSISKLTDSLMSMIPDWLKNFGSAFLDFFSLSGEKSIVTKVKKGFSSLWESIKNGVSYAFSSMKTIANSLWSMLPNTLKDIASKVADYLTMGLSTLDWSKISDFSSFTSQIVDRVKGFFASLVNLIPENVRKLISGAVTSAVGKVEEGWSSFKSMVGFGESSGTPTTVNTASKASPIPQEVNTKTSTLTTQVEAKKPDAVQPTNNTTVVNNNNGGSKPSIKRELNTGRNETNRNIASGKFAFR